MQSVFKHTLRSTKYFNSKYPRYVACTKLESNNYNHRREKDSKKYNTTSRHIVKFLLFTVSGYLGYNLFKNKTLIPTVNASIPVSNLFGRRGQFNFVADVVELTEACVVYIEIKDHRRTDFFTGRPITTSNGSGFIIKSDGLIVTNAHVIINKPNSKIEVRLLDGSVHAGVVEDVDLNSDLALIRIPVKNLPAIKLGNSKDMRAGEFVVAIGSPLALSNSCTCGVISSPHRGSEELGLKNKEMVYIQTDAAITFGNSGGPLVNLDGEAIGVNSMKVTAGISFAIPIDYVKTFLSNTKGPKKIADDSKRKYMGITMLTITPQILRELYDRQQLVPSDVRHGILIWKVIFGSPAHAGGLQPGDIVTHINEKPVNSVNDIYEILRDPKNDSLLLSVVRSGRRLKLYVVPEKTN